MNSASLAGVVGAVSAAFVTGLLTYLATAWKVRRDLQVEYDRGLRTDRLKAYAQLWARTRPFSRYAPATMDAYRCSRLVESLSDWYYAEGGMYLSTATRDRYFAFMDILAQAGDSNAQARIELLRDSASDLRTQISADVG